MQRSEETAVRMHHRSGGATTLPTAFLKTIVYTAIELHQRTDGAAPFSFASMQMFFTLHTRTSASIEPANHRLMIHNQVMVQGQLLCNRIGQ